LNLSRAKHRVHGTGRIKEIKASAYLIKPQPYDGHLRISRDTGPIIKRIPGGIISSAQCLFFMENAEQSHGTFFGTFDPVFPAK
jgi:hypothetical protein